LKRLEIVTSGVTFCAAPLSAVVRSCSTETQRESHYLDSYPRPPKPAEGNDVVLLTVACT